MDEVLSRLQAFAALGAHVVYAPGINSLEQVKLIADNVDKPQNVLSPFFPNVSLGDLGAAGATRVSLGNVLLERARGSFRQGMQAMIDSGMAS